jgi:hypothetical protein
MLRATASCDVGFTHKQFLYQAGMLHSADDRPAAVFESPRPASEFTGLTLPLRDLYLSTMHTNLRGSNRVFSLVTYSTRKYETCSKQTCWYLAGDLHRDYGPAIAGSYEPDEEHEQAYPWWYKYHRGKQMASETNTFMGERLELSSRMRAYCCGCAKLVVYELIEHYDNVLPYQYDYVGVYRTCDDLILECRSIESVLAQDNTNYQYFRVASEMRDDLHYGLYRLVDLIP